MYSSNVSYLLLCGSLKNNNESLIANNFSQTLPYLSVEFSQICSTQCMLDKDDSSHVAGRIDVSDGLLDDTHGLLFKLDFAN